MTEYENDLETMRNRLAFKEAQVQDLLDKIEHLELQLATAKDQLVLERNRSWQ